VDEHSLTLMTPREPHAATWAALTGNTSQAARRTDAAASALSAECSVLPVAQTKRVGRVRRGRMSTRRYQHGDPTLPRPLELTMLQ